jgi:hypothetical protein
MQLLIGDNNPHKHAARIQSLSMKMKMKMMCHFEEAPNILDHRLIPWSPTM